MTENDSFRYDERIIAFIDILGFSEFVIESDADSEKAQVVYDLMSNVKKNIKDEYESDFRQYCKLDNQLLFISDTIIISHPFHLESADRCFFNIIQDIQRFIMLIMKQGFLCRGAICFGNVHHNKDEIFGKAYIDALMLESRCAIYPRIILSKELEELIKSSAVMAHTLKDKDDYYFIDYLEGYQNFDEGILTINNIIKKLEVTLESEKDYHILEKYFWLKDYLSFSIEDEHFSLKGDMYKRFTNPHIKPKRKRIVNLSEGNVVMY